MNLSIVVCTRNRAAQLAGALQRYARLEPAELILVDNGSTDGTPQVIDDFRSRGGYRGTVRAAVEREPGLGRARNRGWREASGEVVAFSDDDCYPAPDFVSRMSECFQPPEIGFVGGRILLYDATDIRLTIQELDQRVEVPPRSFIPAGLIQGANFAVRREVLQRIGGFDDRFGAGTPFACEDVDVIARASAEGYAGAYDPRPVVYHHHGRKSWQSDGRRLMRIYDLARGAYYTKTMLHPAMRSTYARRWAAQMARQSPFITLRELRGGLKFLLAQLGGQGAGQPPSSVP